MDPIDESVAGRPAEKVKVIKAEHGIFKEVLTSLESDVGVRLDGRRGVGPGVGGPAKPSLSLSERARSKRHTPS